MLCIEVVVFVPTLIISQTTPFVGMKGNNMARPMASREVILAYGYTLAFSVELNDDSLTPEQRTYVVRRGTWAVTTAGVGAYTPP